MKHLLFKLQSFLVLLVFTAASAYAQKSPVDMNRFIDDLMKKMTLEEKIGQLNLPVTGEITTGQAKSSNVAKRIRAGEVGGLFNLKGVERIRDVQKQAVEESRLGIPLLFGMDVIHGYETVFPIPLGLSCTWDMKAVEESARIAAIESSADGICWTFSPMVDICRDARWGRVSEGNGEDPFLGAAIAQAMVRGYQGKDMSRNDEIMACVKHFALYGAGEAGRGFAVVASQIQKLADQSNESANQIDQIIHALIEDSEKAVKTMDEVKTIMNLQSENVHKTGQVFEQVRDGISSSISGVGEIATRTTQLDKARGDVVDVVQNLTAIAQQNAASTEETSASVMEVSNVMQEIMENANRLKEIASILEENMNSFTL